MAKQGNDFFTPEENTENPELERKAKARKMIDIPIGPSAMAVNPIILPMGSSFPIGRPITRADLARDNLIDGLTEDDLQDL